MKILWPAIVLALLLANPFAALAQEEEGPMPPPRSTRGNRQTPAPSNAPLPRSDTAGSGESSSKDTKLPAESTPASDVGEMKPWDPHKAEKNIEVGDYYFKKKNYVAAISRYREALYWKKDDAVALVRLGQALETTGQYSEARERYGRYLEVLPNGPSAAETRKALARLKDKSDSPKQLEAPTPTPGSLEVVR